MQVEPSQMNSRVKTAVYVAAYNELSKQPDFYEPKALLFCTSVHVRGELRTQ